MTKQTKWTALACLLCLLLALGTGTLYRNELGLSSCSIVIDKTISKKPFDSEAARAAEIQLIRLDLNEYPSLSTTLKDEIAQAINDGSERYKIPPFLAHSIFQIESDYKFNVDHPTVRIKVRGKYVVTHCQGLGGILWEFWGEKLKAEGICETSSDLYVPRNNIMATFYVLRTIINEELAVSHGRADSWIVQRIITKYYGVKNPAYEKKMAQVTSSLWLKRMAREIVNWSVVPTATDTANQQ